MARLKIDYGIDLGTTNSAICRMEKGEPTIIKSDTLKDTMPSCVAFTKKQSTRVGDVAINNMTQDKRRATKSWKLEASNTFIEFKRTMATDTKHNSNFMGRSFSSEELSAEVLKALKSFVTDENIRSAVITVPAKFTVNQKTATMKAAKLAGITQCELLQEPVAAAMAYGLTAEDKNGTWMVFDFGGGTFDAALLKAEDGIIQVFDTEGDNYLGGKNLDYAIVDKIIIPYLQENYALDEYLDDEENRTVLRDAMKTYAEEVKNQLSFKDHEDIISNLGELGEDEDGEEIELDLTISQEEVFEVMRPIFQNAVDICKELLRRNGLKQLDKLILVGGPTHSPLVRQMLREQITPNVDTSIDPMTAVATGAALYASTIDAEVDLRELTQETVQLEVHYQSTSVEEAEYVTVKIAPGQKTQKVYVELVRADKAWSSGKSEVTEKGNVLDAMLLTQKPNSFTILCYDEQGNSLPCFPEEITIIQGSKVGAATLPYNIGISVWDERKESEVFRMAKGLEKNKHVPATGSINGRKTNNQLRPGMECDQLRIPIYQVDDFKEAEGRPSYLYEYVGDVVVTGDDVDELIPSNSPVDVTLKVDSSEQMTLEVYFSATDTTVEKSLNTGKQHSTEEARQLTSKYLEEGKRKLRRLKQYDIDIKEAERELTAVEEDAETNNEAKAVLEHLKAALRKIESLEESSQWQRCEKELRETFERLESAQEELGSEESKERLRQLRLLADRAIESRDCTAAENVTQQADNLYFQLTMVYQCIGCIKDFDKRFGSLQWKDSSRARQLINKGKDICNDYQPTTKQLLPIVQELFALLPERERPSGSDLLS